MMIKGPDFFSEKENETPHLKTKLSHVRLLNFTETECNQMFLVVQPCEDSKNLRYCIDRHSHHHKSDVALLS